MRVTGKRRQFTRLTLEQYESRICLAAIAFTPHAIVEADAPSILQARLGDIDGDGDLDVVYFARSAIGWYENLGKANFAPRKIVTEEQSASFQSLTIVDIDGDGDRDIFVDSWKSGSFHTEWYENLNGKGDFGPQQVVSQVARHSVLADFDGDQKPDVAWINASNGALFWQANQDGRFGSRARKPIGSVTEIEQLVAGDLDGDGDADLVAASRAAGTFWFENVGNGKGFVAKPMIATNGRFRALSLDDMDGDGDMDVIASLRSLVWLENTSEFNRTWPEHEIAPPYDIRRAALPIGDIDGDGDADVLSTSNLPGANDRKLAWYENTGQGFRTNIVTRDFRSLGSLALGDLDGDGDLDALSVDKGDMKLGWYENIDGLGTFSRQEWISNPGVTDPLVAVVDADGDNDLDLVTSSRAHDSVFWYENSNGQGSYETRTAPIGQSDSFRINYPIDGRANSLAVLRVDIDGDGKFESLAASRDSAVADLNADGLLDIVRTYRVRLYTENIRWHENMQRFGVGLYGPQQHIATTGHYGSVATSDIDGDGHLDVVSGSNYAISWHQNVDGLGTFAEPHVMASGINGAESDVFITVADVDGDGDTDVLYSGSHTAWLRNRDGKGDFAAPQRLGDLRGARRLAVGELDLDGDLDVVVTGQGELAWLENVDGKGNFGAKQVLKSGVMANGSLAIADIDNDGDLDVIAASTSAHSLAWYESDLVDRAKEQLPGDANRNGKVTFADFLALSANFGKTKALWADGDFNGDTSVTFDDFLILAENFARR